MLPHDLSKVAILIKTFLRDLHLVEAIEVVRARMPEVQLIIVDDGQQTAVKHAIYDQLIRSRHRVALLPFDSGFGRKSNVGAELCTRPYLLIGSDDFDFSPVSVRAGIEKLVDVLEDDDQVAIASGRVNGNRYEGWLEDHGNRIVERYENNEEVHYTQNGTCYHYCNLTVNYSLIRREILGPDKIHWDDDVKIGGGEHGAFFVDVMRAGHHVAWVPGVDIKEQVGKPTDPRYGAFRSRATQPGRPCFKRRGIDEYVMFGGGVERP